MSLVLRKSVIAANSAAAAHYKNTVAQREAFNAAGSTALTHQVDRELWAHIDAQTVDIMQPVQGEALYSLLFPLAKTVDIGDIAALWRKSGDEFAASSSVDGQHVKPLQRTAAEWDGTVIPVHTSSFYENWREAGRNRAQFVDDQAAAVRAVRARIVDDIFNGTENASFKGLRSVGILNSPNVQALDLVSAGVDFSSPSLTLANARKGIIAIVQGLIGAANGATGAVDILIDSDSYFNLVTLTAGTSDTKSFLDIVRELPGVKSIQPEIKLGTNQAIGLIASQEYIAPLVGAAVTTYAEVRTGQLDNYNYTTWGASGLQIKADAAGRSGVLFASGA